MNRDGTIDIVFASCPPSERDCYINIVYNKQVGLCEKQLSAAGTRGGSSDPIKAWSDWWFGTGATDGQTGTVGGLDKCRRTEDLCVADDQFAFDFEGSAATGVSRIERDRRSHLDQRLTSLALPPPPSLSQACGYPSPPSCPDISLC